MRVCDRCKDIKKPAVEFTVTLSRPGAGAERQRLSKVKDTGLELCDECVETFWNNVNTTIAANLAGCDVIELPREERTRP